MTCARCTLRERLTDLLTDPATGHVHADLTPLFDELVGSDRPQTGLSWLRKKPGVGPQILRQMARSELEVSHAAFHSLPSDRAHDYLRTLLAAVGVLEPFDPRLERMMPWLEEFLATVPAQHAELLRRYARWHVLRRMRRAAERSQLTQASANGARRRIRVAAEFLAYLDSHGMTAQSATQRVLEEFQRHAGRPLQYERGFIAWLRNTRINTALEIPYVPGPQPQIRVGEEHRWAIVDQLLHDTSIRRYTRIGGLFTLLFAQPLTRIVTTRVDQVADRGGRVYVTFGAAPVQMPPVVDDLIREHLQHRGKSLYAARGTQWLFPRRQPRPAPEHGEHPSPAGPARDQTLRRPQGRAVPACRRGPRARPRRARGPHQQQRRPMGTTGRTRLAGLHRRTNPLTPHAPPPATTNRAPLINVIGTTALFNSELGWTLRADSRCGRCRPGPETQNLKNLTLPHAPAERRRHAPA